MDYIKEFTEILYPSIKDKAKNTLTKMSEARKFLYDNRNNMTADQFDECLCDYGNYNYEEC